MGLLSKTTRVDPDTLALMVELTIEVDMEDVQDSLNLAGKEKTAAAIGNTILGWLKDPPEEEHYHAEPEIVDGKATVKVTPYTINPLQQKSE